MARECYGVEAGAEFPATRLSKLGGGELSVGGEGGWRMLVVYRGKHCPICGRYLTRLGEELAGRLDELGVETLLASADTKEQAEEHLDGLGLARKFPVGYGMTREQMDELGLYVSHPRSAEDTDHDYPEPGLFVINPQGKVQIVDVSNAPFSRPDLSEVVRGIGIIQERSYPVRGDA